MFESRLIAAPAALLLVLWPMSNVALTHEEFRATSIAVSADGERLVTVNPDSGSISLVDIVGRSVIREIPVGIDPAMVTINAEGTVAWVTLRGDDRIAKVDLEFGLVTTLESGRSPVGVLSDHAGRVYVSVSGTREILVLNAVDLEILATIPVADRPHGLALTADRERLLVTHLLSGELTVIDTESLTILARIQAGTDANLSRSVVVDPDSSTAWMPHTRSNSTNPALLFDTTLFPVASAIDLMTLQNDVRRRIAFDIVDQPVNIPIDATITSDRRMVVVHAGSNDATVIDLGTGTSPGRFSTGHSPIGVALSPFETEIYVNNALSGSVTIVDANSHQVLDEVVVTAIPLAPDVLNGKRLFNSSARTDLAKDHWISCAGCHPGDGMDGRTWFFRDGPRNTPSLLGVVDTLPVHWSGDLDELQDVESTIRTIQAGTGLAPLHSGCDPACDQAPPNAGRSQDLDDLAAYMRTLTLRPSPNLVSGRLSGAARRGLAIFFSPATGCAECHPPPLFTDRKKHDVGTATDPSERKGSSFDTPSLRGIHETAPYFHDGSAATLKDVLTTRNPTNQHGRTSGMSQQDVDDLISFLRSLPYPLERSRGVRRPG